MELSDVILALVGILPTGSIFVIKNIMTDIKELEHTMNSCQSNMPRDYVLKSDYKTEASEIKTMIIEQSKKIDQIWKHMRIGNGKD